MPTQNLNTYYYPKYRSLLNSGQYFDLTLAADERDYDEEVVFSTDIIAANDGTRLPIRLDLTILTPVHNFLCLLMFFIPEQLLYQKIITIQIMMI